MALGGFGGAGAARSKAACSKDFTLPLPSEGLDTVSSVRWNPQGNALACASWDNRVRLLAVAGTIYASICFAAPMVFLSLERKLGRVAAQVLVYGIDADTTGPKGANPAGMQDYKAPALSVTWKDVRVYPWRRSLRDVLVSQNAVGNAMLRASVAQASTLLYAGCNQTLDMWDVTSGAVQTVGKHDGPIRHCVWCPDQSVVATGGWDNALHFWDVRSPSSPAISVRLPERVYAMDVAKRLVVVGLADRQVALFDMNNPSAPARTLESPLRYQTRCVGCIKDGSGFAIGSIEGRAAVRPADPALEKDKAFAFKCHRNGDEIFAVNDVSFNPTFQHSFATAGSDGSFIFWHKEDRIRLEKPFDQHRVPITSMDWSPSGQLLAYAHGYDWSKGADSADPARFPTSIHIHTSTEQELTPTRGQF